MKIEVVRPPECGPVCTIGEMFVDGKFECFTLEDVVRPTGVKVYGETAIPEGTYPIDVTYSPRFKKELPLVMGVKGFTGIRIHAGNTKDNTEGCILVGRSKGRDRVNESRLAFNTLFEKLKAAKARKEPITLIVR